jgi:alginate O-acetyltransferase complex protein AlgI
MSLSSLPFIFIFLPIFILLYYLVPKAWWRKAVLFLGSLVFFTWIDPNHMYILVTSILFNYLFGRVIARTQNPGGNSKTALWLTVFAVTCNLGLLIYYKYSDFILSNIQFLRGFEWVNQQTVLPLGISFFTFTGISYIIDIYHQVEKSEKNFFKFANYLMMFPKIMLGPITRYTQVVEELPAKWFTNQNFGEGLRRFAGGLGKKIILADNFAIVANKVFESDYTNLPASVAWLGLIAYTLQLYFDFSGYTDMAVGLGLMLGYQLPENFNFPYVARSVGDFWRRWHMTLTAWFRTYIFTPLEFKGRRAGAWRQPLNLLIVFLLTGLWHGAAWSFIIWGGYYGILLAVESIGLGKLLKKIPAVFQHLYTVLVIVVGWVFFKVIDIGLWGSFFKALVGANPADGTVTTRSLNILLFIPLILFGILWSTPIFAKREKEIVEKGGFGKIVIFIFYVAVFALAVSYILANGYQSFLYAQF